MKIERERFCLVHKSRHGAQILCTVSNEPRWVRIVNLENELIRSYASEAKARQAFKRHFGAWNPNRYRVIRVLETYEQVNANSNILKEARLRKLKEQNLNDELMGGWGDVDDTPKKKKS